MADKKKDLQRKSAEKEKLNKAQTTPENNKLSLEERLKAAAGNIAKASADNKALSTELAKRRAKSEKEAEKRIADAEKRREQNEKIAQKAAEEKIAAFDYAQNYRKKLIKERDAAANAAKQKNAEAREAAAKEAKEASDREAAALIEQERREAQERNQRAQAVLDSVTKREAEAEVEPAVEAETPAEKSEQSVEQKPAGAEETTEEQEVASDSAAEEVAEIATAEQAPADEKKDEPAEEKAEDLPTEEKAEELSTEEKADEAQAEQAEQDAPAEEKTDDAPEVVEAAGDQIEEAPTGDADAEEKTEESPTSEETSEEKAEDTPTEELSDENDVITVEYDVKPAREDDNEGFEMVFDDDGRLIVKRESDDQEAQVTEPEQKPEPEQNVEKKPEPEKKKPLQRDIPEVSDEQLRSFNERYKEHVEKYRKDRQRAKGIDPDAEKPESADEVLILHDEIIAVIKAEGARLDGDDRAIKVYMKHSSDAIKTFEKALRVAKHAYDTNIVESEGPTLLVGILKICTKLLEIKCNNLENLARLKANKYIRNARISLRDEVERYNDYVITYASITGEQPTRLSTLLPDNIATGKSLAVIPAFSYKESYVELYPDENGNVTSPDGAELTVILPGSTADELSAKIKKPKKQSHCRGFGRRIKRAVSKLAGEVKQLSRLIHKNKFSKKKYENDLRSLDAQTSVEDRSNRKYKEKVLRISIGYGKKLSGIKTSRTKSAFARTRQRLLVTRLAAEKEKLKLACTYLNEVHRAGNYTQKKLAQDYFVDVALAYNKCAENCSKIFGGHVFTVSPAMIEQVCAGERELKIPVVAYKRELVETVLDSSRTISTALASSVMPDEIGYAENSANLLGSTHTMKDNFTLADESPMTDRAAAVAKVVIDTLREEGRLVYTIDDLNHFMKSAARAVKFFRKSIKATEKAMSRAFDDDGLIIALLENLRVISNLIEVRRISIETAVRLERKDYAKADSRALYKEIELYNGRAIDYTSIVGEQFSRITAASPKELINLASTMKVPTITYKDNYIEVFPKDPLKEMSYEKPYQRNRKERTGYTPLLMKHYRLTENRAVEFSLVNSPFIFDATVNDDQIQSWRHPIGFFQHLFVFFQPIGAWFRRMATNAEIWFIDESTLFSKSGVANRQKRNDKRRARLEARLEKLRRTQEAKILALETVVHDADRHSAAYHTALYKINNKFNRKIYRVKIHWMRTCTGRTHTRLLIEQLVLERERLSGINKVLLKYRAYGRITLLPNVLNRYKRKFLEAITAHNKTAAKLSELLGTPFSEVSTSVADEIIRYGNIIKFPHILCCREVVENIDKSKRTIGDKWHGYGLYNGSGSDSGTPPVMSVGAMGYATEMGIPFLRNAGLDQMTMLGVTPGGVPLIGFSDNGETKIPFTGTPMMLQGTDESVVLDAGIYGKNGPTLGATSSTNPYSGIHSAGVDAIYIDESEDSAMDLNSGSCAETPVDLESKLIEERFSRALRARSMTVVDSTLTWWKLVFSEINVAWMRALFLRDRGFIRFLLPPKDPFTENVNEQVIDQDEIDLEIIARLGTIIDIECKRLHSATLAGIRRSQRVWSAWLHCDIERYNARVNEYNTRNGLRNIDVNDTGPRIRLPLELLSLSIPDRIISRLDDRPPSPPVYSFRNKVRQGNTPPIRVNGLYNALINYAMQGWFRNPGLFTWLLAIPRFFMWVFNALGWQGAAMSRAVRLISARQRRTEARRFDNELRYYRIRYEKARAMKRFNRRIISANGVANDAIRYQSKAHSSLRRYSAENFRIDYNMRIRQLIYRSFRVGLEFYWAVIILASCALMIFNALSIPALVRNVITLMAMAWALLPVIFLIIKLIYDVVMLIVSVLLLITRNIWLIKYGTRDVERNKYGITLDCFVAEQYKLLVDCYELNQRPQSRRRRRILLSTINEYNKKCDKYSKILKVPISEIEPTSLIDKLTSGDASLLLDELQNFIYVRELVVKTDEHDIGDVTSKRELETMHGLVRGELNDVNEIISIINQNNPEAANPLNEAVNRIIRFIESGKTPTENERFEMKLNVFNEIKRFRDKNQNQLTSQQIETFTRNINKLVDSLGKKPKRKILGVLALDNMIDLQ